MFKKLIIKKKEKIITVLKLLRYVDEITASKAGPCRSLSLEREEGITRSKVHVDATMDELSPNRTDSLCPIANDSLQQQKYKKNSTTLYHQDILKYGVLLFVGGAEVNSFNYIMSIE